MNKIFLHPLQQINRQKSLLGLKAQWLVQLTWLPEPGAKPFVKIGAKVKKGDTVLIIEAMKTMNHIPSTQDGEVEEILVKDGESVEFDQELIKIK